MLSKDRILPVVALGMLAALGGAWLAQKFAPPTPVLRAATALPTPRELHNFTLQDTTGAAFGLRDLARAPSLLFFGFTQCPDVCPTTLALLARLRRAAKLPALRVIMISVDPQRDSSAILRQYLAAFDVEFVGLTGSVQAVNALTQDVGVALAQLPAASGGYSIDHSATVFLTDAQGRLKAVFTPPLDPEAMLSDLRALWPKLLK